MDKYEHRRSMLTKLIKSSSGGVNAKFALKIGTDPSYVSRMLYEPGKKGGKRIGDDMVEKIEAALSLPRGTMDGIAQTTHHVLFDEGSTYNIKSGVAHVPVVGRAELGPDGLWSDNGHPVGQGDGFISWPTTDSNAYAVEANGDSMAPRIKHREFIIIEPNAEIMPGDEVLIKTSEEPPRCMVKVFQYERDGRYHLSNINTEFEDFRLDRKQVDKMHFVAGIAKRKMHKHE